MEQKRLILTSYSSRQAAQLIVEQNGEKDSDGFPYEQGGRSLNV
jgi:hypothetical protein